MTDISHRTRRLRWCAAVAAAFLLGGLYSALVITQRIFPYHQLGAAERLLFPQGPERPDRPQTIATSVLRLETRTYTGADSDALLGRGGGLVRVRNAVLGVDRAGTFFVYRGGGEIRRIDLGLDSNRQAFLEHVSRVVPEESLRARLAVTMRVAGIAARETAAGLDLFVAHQFWHADTAEKSLRISRLLIPDVGTLLVGRLTAEPRAWDVVFDSWPRIGFDPADPSPFNTDHSGGRIVVASDGKLLVGTGDQRYDGVTVPRIASQDETSSYGKILRIDPDSGDVTVHAMGLRNPQGLTFDRDGNLWATDHGPEGGDELNAIVSGGNYGWPVVTLGTDYGKLEWPLNRRQGRHDGFAQPVYAWTPSIGVSNVIQIQREPEAWDGDLLVASLVGRSLFRLRMIEDRVALSEAIPIGERIRDLVQLADGSVLLWVDSGSFIELRPTRLD